MTESESIGGAGWRHDLAEFKGELGRMLQLRRDLATLEFNHDRQLLRRCAIIGGCGAALLLTTLPLLLQLVADKLAENSSLSVVGWTLILAGALGSLGLCLVIVARRKLRSELRALRDTRAELDEDLIWLQEWVPHDWPAHRAP